MGRNNNNSEIHVIKNKKGTIDESMDVEGNSGGISGGDEECWKHVI